LSTIETTAQHRRLDALADITYGLHERAAG